MPGQPVLAIGLMSGTSMDGIDAALLRTDGVHVAEPQASLTVAYDDEIRTRLRHCVERMGAGVEPDGLAALETDLTLAHADAAAQLLASAGVAPGAVAYAGFHGHTVLHDPEARRTRQIGDGGLLARRLGIAVVDDFRSRDMAAGGQGAPLVPIYHAALAREMEKPLCVLNLGGVANVTWIEQASDGLMAFDTGPGSALIDDYVRRHLGVPYDEDGRIAAGGSADEQALEVLTANDYFARRPPKSLDRYDFDPSPVNDLAPPDAVATLTAFSAQAAAMAAAHLPGRPRRWLVAGGGRHNRTLMAALGSRLAAPVGPVEDVGWDGDALEAQAFAYLGVRSAAGLAITFPGTTGVTAPLTGGTMHQP